MGKLMPAERAILFIDGSNFYHAARGVGVAAGNLDYRKLARRLILDRELTGIRYYVGRVSGDIHRIAEQISGQATFPRYRNHVGPNRADHADAGQEPPGEPLEAFARDHS